MSRGISHPVSEISSLAQLTRLLRVLKPDLVHSFSLKPILYSGLALGCLSRTRAVCTFTGLGYIFIDSKLSIAPLRAVIVGALRRVIARRYSALFFQNASDKAHLLKLGIGRSKPNMIIPGSGVPASEYPSTLEPAGLPLVTMPSRMLWDKGVKEFVEAARSIREEGIQARFALVGDTDPGNPAAVPEDQLKAWQSAGYVEWWGRQSDMKRVFSLSAIVCLPSYREGLPRVLIEAALSRRAVVTADSPGCRDVVEHEQTGLVVPVRDAPALSHAIRTLLLNPEVRARMGSEAEARALVRFSPERLAAQHLAVYDRITKDNQS